MTVQMCRLEHEHKHGQNTTCYVTGRCRCRDCRAFRAAQQRDYVARRAAGELQVYAPVAPVRKHIHKLMAARWRYKDIEKVSGVSCPTIRRISTGEAKRVTEETADAILGTAVTMRHKALPPSKVDATGTRRRLQALAAQGWTLRELTNRLGFDFSRADGIMRQASVHVKTADAVKALFEELWDKHPPVGTKAERTVYARTVTHARKQGWCGPLHWDDIDTDPEPVSVEDDADGVDTLAVELAVHGDRPKLTQAERHLVVPRLHALRWSDGKIGAWIGVSSKTVGRDRVELGLAAWDQNDLEDERQAA